MQFSSQDDVQSGSIVDAGAAPCDLHPMHHLWLKAVLLAVWVVSSFGVVFFARDLQAWVQGWQLGYWMAAQGAVLMFMLIALVYCVAMDSLERRAVPSPVPADRTAATHARSPER